jgi:Cu/Ag efflux pump CusA
VVNTNAAELWVSIDPAADQPAVVAAIEEVVAGYPGLVRAVTTYSNQRVGDVLSAPDQDIVVRLYGQDQAILRTKAEEVREALASIDGVIAPIIEGVAEEPTVEVHVDIAAAERHGLKPGDIRRATTSLLSAIGVGFLFEDQKVFEVVVWGEPELRHSLTSVGDLLLDTPSGVPVRLADVAALRVAPTPTVIRREGVMRILDVGATVECRDVGAVMADVEGRLAGISFPLEYHAEVRGVAAEREADQIRLLAVFLAAAIGIFLLLQATFASWRLASMAVLVLPAALAGGFAMIYATGGGIHSLGAVTGLLAVAAIAVRNGVAHIVACQQLEREVGDGAPHDLVLHRARERLATTVLTAAATALAVAPFVLLGSLPGFEMVRPMALVILGGWSPRHFTLFVIPAATWPARRVTAPTVQSIEAPAPAA